jgi:hypothetical protein
MPALIIAICSALPHVVSSKSNVGGAGYGANASVSLPWTCITQQAGTTTGACLFHCLQHLCLAYGVLVGGMWSRPSLHHAAVTCLPLSIL